jgi:hypothetical protein
MREGEEPYGLTGRVAVLFVHWSLAAFAQIPSSQRVVLVIDENTTYRVLFMRLSRI